MGGGYTFLLLKSIKITCEWLGYKHEPVPNCVNHKIDSWLKLFNHYQECNEFLAGNVLRSASRYYKLDETAAFGSICRHDFPSLFLNLKHGERYVWCCANNVDYQLNLLQAIIWSVFD